MATLRIPYIKHFRKSDYPKLRRSRRLIAWLNHVATAASITEKQAYKGLQIVHSVEKLQAAGALAEAPVNTVAPAITGTVASGNTVTCGTGTWVGHPTPTYTYQWIRDGLSIVSAAAAYTLLAADIGHTFECRVTGTNSLGSSVAASNTIQPTA
jgi:hypothetical protein